MKVLLINPPLKSSNPDEPVPFPLGLGYLAAAVRDAGHQVTLLDGSLGLSVSEPHEELFYIGLSIPEIVTRAIQEEPEVIGISIPFTSRLKVSVEILQRLKKTMPDVPIVAGGMHATVDPEALLDNGVDAVLLGEAERSFVKYLHDGCIKGDLTGVAHHWEGSKQIRIQTDHITDLDELLFPARDLVPFETYLKRSGGRWIRQGLKVASVISSRGCPYRCTFCSAFRVAGRKYRKRSPENVLAEIDELVHRYKTDVIAFEDDNLTADRQRAVDLFEGIMERFHKLQWITPNGISIKNLDRDLIQLMRRSGCRSVNLAFESGDPHILQEVMKKNLDPEDGSRVRNWCREAGIAVNGYFVLGMPGETIDSMERTRDYALSLDLDGIGIFIATPFRGTELYDLCQREGYLDAEYARGDVLFQSDPEVLHKPLIETPWLKKQDLVAFQTQFDTEFMDNFLAKRPMARIKNWLRPIVQKAGWGK
ncbi:B12-binding domain-containing radical SAM protein [bacterium]|nr:B12-binding domain-containing radical SAM protein [bacterium]